MFIHFVYFILIGLLSGFASVGNAQSRSQTLPGEQNLSRYDYVEAFRPFFTTPGNRHRSASGQPGPDYWQNRADYKIQAHLDEAQRKITATVTLLYTNNSPDQLDFLWIQLDQNLFAKNSRGRISLPPSNSRYGDSHSTFDGGYQISAVQDQEGSPFAYEISDTRMQVFPRSPIPPNGGRLQIQISYSYTIPEQGADRTGVLQTANGAIFAIAQWFPRVAVYDEQLGWNTNPYMGPGEFYLEYGDYEIDLTVPASHILVCGAELLNPEETYTPEQNRRLERARERDETQRIRSPEEVTQPDSRPKGTPGESGVHEITWKFRLKNARDIAWASSEAFVLDGARINLPSGQTALALSAYPIESIGNNGWERSTEYTKAAVEHYSETWFEYPYPVAVNVAANVGGMEYPAISFCNYRSLAGDLWGVTDHEVGHNWFPMIVGSNERLHAWMDEGINMMINEISTEAFNGGEYHRPLGNANRLARIYTRPGLEPVMTPPHHMLESNIGVLVYYKPAFGLLLLRNEILGPSRFDRALRTYIERWAFKHPTPEDFFRTIENVSGENLSWFWRGWFQQNWSLDQGIRSVSHPGDDPKNGIIIVVDNLEQLPAPLVLDITTVSGEVHRLRFPVEIWERSQTYTVRYPSTEEVTRVQIDPDHVFPDRNPENNRWESNNE